MSKSSKQNKPDVESRPDPAPPVAAPTPATETPQPASKEKTGWVDNHMRAWASKVLLGELPGVQVTTETVSRARRKAEQAYDLINA
jgi:hypothetical protein